MVRSAGGVRCPWFAMKADFLYQISTRTVITHCGQATSLRGKCALGVVTVPGPNLAVLRLAISNNMFARLMA
jgi:hypothetical protein